MSHHRIFFFITTATLFNSCIKVHSLGHIYALSTTYLEHLSQIELELYPRFKEYAKNLQNRIQQTQEYISDYEESGSGSTRWEVAAHPLASYRMIRRFASIFSPLSRSICEDLELLEYLTQPQGGLGYPDKVNQENAMGSILRMQYIYNLNVSDLVEGVLQDLETNIGLTPRQTLEFAKYALDLEYYTFAWDFLTAAKSQPNNNSGLADEITATTNSLMQSHDSDFERNKKERREFIFTQPLRNSSSPEKKPTGEGLQGDTTTRHLQICRGANLQSEEEKSSLYCHLDSKRNPFFILQPLKIEQLSSTGLLLFHQIIPHGWINELKAASLPSLKTSEILYKSNEGDRNEYPVGWEFSKAGSEGILVQQRLELILSRNLKVGGTGEELRVQLYSSGGDMDLHNDAASPGFEHRRATLLLYMSDVELGGVTAFVNLGIGVNPTIGSGIYWESYDRKSNIDFSTLHGGCPVLLGHKWISTQWISESAK